MTVAPPAPVCDVLTPEEIVRDLRDLPSAPKVLPRLKVLLSDTNSSMHEVVRLIRLDPGIAARVLRVGNSAYYNHGDRCVTVDEAVNRVGYGQIYELVSYAVASQVLVRPLATYGIEADDLWRMSVACALAAEEIANRSGQECDVAYTVGLLHGLGMAAIDDWAQRHRPELRFPSLGFPRESAEAERAALGFTQADVGAELLREWDFQNAMWEPVRWQYAPRSCTAHMRMACLLHSAKWVRSTVCATDGQSPPLPSQSAIHMLSLRPGELQEIVAVVTRRLHEVSALLDIDIANPRDALRFPNDHWGN